MQIKDIQDQRYSLQREICQLEETLRNHRLKYKKLSKLMPNLLRKGPFYGIIINKTWDFTSQDRLRLGEFTIRLAMHCGNDGFEVVYGIPQDKDPQFWLCDLSDRELPVNSSDKTGTSRLFTNYNKFVRFATTALRDPPSASQALHLFKGYRREFLADTRRFQALYGIRFGYAQRRIK